MRLEFDIYEFLRRQLPIHKRQENRLALFDWALNQIRVVWNQFVNWRSEMIYESNITGQKIALVNLLNRRVEGSGNNISIAEKDDGGLFIGTATESLDYLYMSTATENTDNGEFPKEGELVTALTADFVVYVPVGVNVDQVAEIVDRYVIAGYDYEIQQNII